MKVYFDPNFSFNELIDYYAPAIIDINGKKYIDLHSMSTINLLGLTPKNSGIEIINGIVLTFVEFDDENLPEVLTDSLIEQTPETFKMFSISNAISLRQMYQMAFSGQYLLRIENTPNNLEFLVSLCSQYVLNNADYFQDKRFEILLQMTIFLELKKFSEKTKITYSMPQPFIFIFDISQVSLEEVHRLMDEITTLNQVLTKKVDLIYKYAKDKISS
ncbi:MAG: hypothetical protein ACPL3B_05335, partial [Fervidobacterium sp.]